MGVHILELPQLKIDRLLPRVPIIQGGMAVRVSTASLAGAVAREGGIGVIAATGMSVKELKNEIKMARSLADGGIIGVNIMVAAHLFIDLVRTSINEKIDLILTGAGFSREIFQLGKEGNTPIVPIVSSPKAARLAEKCGAAAIVAEGTEAGGHLGTDQSIRDILPLIRDVVNIPVIAAGGIVNGRDIADMVKLGANGVQMATRFVLSEECSVADAFKQAYLQAKEEDVVIIKSPVGMPGRAIKNAFIKLVEEKNVPKREQCAHCLKSCTGDYCILSALVKARNGRINEGVVFAGKNVFKIKEILPVKEIISSLIAEYSAVQA